MASNQDEKMHQDAIEVGKLWAELQKLSEKMEKIAGPYVLADAKAGGGAKLEGDYAILHAGMFIGQIANDLSSLLVPGVASKQDYCDTLNATAQFADTLTEIIETRRTHLEVVT